MKGKLSEYFEKGFKIFKKNFYCGEQIA